MKILYSIQMKTIQVSIPLQNHKLNYQQNLNLVENQIELLTSRQNTHDPRSYLDTSPHRNITFNLPTHTDETKQDETQSLTSTHDSSVNVSSPTRTIIIIPLDLDMILHQFLPLFSS